MSGKSELRRIPRGERWWGYLCGGAGKLLLFALGCGVSASVTAALIGLGVLRLPWPASLEREYAVHAGAQKALRILVLGDSFLSPWRTDRHLAKDLEAYTVERGIGLVNTAAYGFGPANYYAQMREVAGEFQPGLVLVFYFAGNDLTDVQYRRPPFVPADASAPAPAPIPPECGLPMRGTRPSGGKGFDWEAMLAHGVDPELVELARAAAAQPEAPHERINPWLLSLATRAPDYLSDNVLMETDCNRAAWRHAARFLTEIFEVAEGVGADVHVVAIPATVQIDRSHFDMYRRATFQVDDRLLASRRPQQLLAELCARHGVPLLDLLPKLERHPDPASLYWRFDPHFSEAGHVFAFRILRDEVLDPWVVRNRPQASSE